MRNAKRNKVEEVITEAPLAGAPWPISFPVHRRDDQPFAMDYCVPERMTSGTWNLLLVAVDPDRQGQGHGSRPTSHVEQLPAARCERVSLAETSGLPVFARTRAFSVRCGYDEEAHIREFHQEGEDKIVYRKALGSSGA